MTTFCTNEDLDDQSRSLSAIEAEDNTYFKKLICSI